MTLIKSISGIRGTIGGIAGEGLTPPDVVKFTAAFARWALEQDQASQLSKSMVVGRDARVSGPLVENLVVSTLQAMGIQVICAGLATTPTVEMAVVKSRSLAGIILTASHNPYEWNALKLLDCQGEFISGSAGATVLAYAEESAYPYAGVNELGELTHEDFLSYHLDRILELPLVNRDAIKNRQFKVVVDAVNSVGGIAVPQLLQRLGVADVVLINGVPDGRFAHNPEPLPEHLVELSGRVTGEKAHLGIAVDPDVDRLAMVCEDGLMFGEEYTLVAVADYFLKSQQGHSVSNLSSSRALSMVAARHGCTSSASPVGEVHVVSEMKRTGAIIGGEGNGGIIVPGLHYGRDALAGIALFLSHLATSGMRMSELRAQYPSLVMDKVKITLNPETDIDRILDQLASRYHSRNPNTSDGVKVDFEESWFHVRKSNTEPIIRVYTEAPDEHTSKNLSASVTREILELVKIC